MASSLRGRVSELERQLQANTRQHQEALRQMEAAHAQRTRQLEADLQQLLSLNEELREHYAAQVHELQDQLLAEMRSHMDAVRQADAAAQAQRQQLLAELAQITESLNDQLTDVRRQEAERTEVGRSMAERLEGEARTQELVVRGLPHAFFRPGQLAVFAEHLESVRTLMQTGMYDAAAAAADASLAELEILEVTVREDQREWEALFAEYRAMATCLRSTMDDFEREAVQTPLGAFRLSDEERDYWSRGQYAAVRAEVDQAWAMVEGVERAGSVGAFLSEGTAAKGTQLVRQITGLHHVSERMSAAMACIRSECSFSYGRMQLADIAEEVLMGQGYHVVRSEFRDGEPIDCYDLELTINGIDKATVTFVPCRTDGIVTRNACLVSLDMRTMVNDDYAARVAQGIVERLQGDEAFIGIEVTWVEEGEQARVAVERRHKAKPDPAALARKLERRYQ